jgi:fatty acid desaturase
MRLGGRMRLDKSRIVEAHEPHWPTMWVWFGFLALFFALLGLLACVLEWGPSWTIVPVILIIAHLMHSHTLAFHEAAHDTLSPHPTWNEGIGLFIGTMSFQSLTAFRTVHHTHHVFLGTERDEELWPFVLPTVPRWIRRLVAAYELTLGITYTPLLCLRTYFRSGSPIRSLRDRRRVACEYVLMAVAWGGILSVVAWLHAWKHLLLAYVIPGILAGDMHSLRKYSEHMGMLGTSILSKTRSIVAPGPLGRFISFSLFNINYHGVHHRYAKIPQARLPHFTALLEPHHEGERPAYSSYASAFLDMVRGLGDPRVGSQWLQCTAVQKEPAMMAGVGQHS